MTKMASGTASFNVVYVDRRATSNRLEGTHGSRSDGSNKPILHNGMSGKHEHEEVDRNIRTLLSVFSSGMLLSAAIVVSCKLINNVMQFLFALLVKHASQQSRTLSVATVVQH